MMNSANRIFVDYVDNETQHEFHLPLTIFKKPGSQKEYDYLESVLDKIIDEVRDNQDHPLALVAQIIGDNIEDFDSSNHHPIGSNVTDVDLVHYLMREYELKQTDMTDIFGNQGNVSKFLNGERQLSKIQIAKLITRFQISADFFFKRKE